MLNYESTRFVKTTQSDVVEGAAFLDEGIAAVYVRDGGTTRIQPSTGAAGEVFAGFSLETNVPPQFMPFVTEFTIAGGVVELPRLPIAGQIAVFIEGTKAALGAGASAPDSAGEANLDADTLAFHADDEGKSGTVQFMFEPSVTEAMVVTGSGPISGLPSAELGVIGLIQTGEISTSYFDANADWTGSELHPSLGADGKLTIGGSGTELTSVVIKSAPSAASPYLTVESF